MHEPLDVPAYIVLANVGEPAASFTWRLWSSRTSFYLKSRAPGVKHLKLSMHSDDPRHEGLAGFKMAMDTEEKYQEALARGEVSGWRTGDWPIWFPGKRINSDATLVVRLRWTWDAATRLPPAPDPGALRDGAKGLAVGPPPNPGDALDLDLVVSKRKPYWFSEPKARRDNACLGPLRNDSGDWLAGTVIRRTASHYPPPAGAVGPAPQNRGDEMRAVGSAIGDGFLWLVEQRMSRSGLATSPG